MTWVNDVRRANDALDWIEARQGPLKPGGYARIETDVRTVRAMTEGQDDARIVEIRERHAPFDFGMHHPVSGKWISRISCTGCHRPWPCEQSVLGERLDALASEASDVARENEALIEEVRASGEQIAALAAERDELRAEMLRLIEVRDRAVDGADRAFREGDAAVARAERAEAALAPYSAHRLSLLTTETANMVRLTIAPDLLPEGELLPLFDRLREYVCRTVPPMLEALRKARAALASASDSISHSGKSSRLSE